MNISGINVSSQNNVSSKQAAPDSHESSLRKKISNLQEELRTISNDQEMTEEQKTRKEHAAKEKMQGLNSELRQYQIQKRQEEAAKKQESVKQALKKASPKPEDDKSVQTKENEETAKTGNNKTEKADSNTSNTENDKKQAPALLGSQEAGVLVTLSSTKEQIADMRRIRTALEGRQRTAPTEEEQASLQEKIAKVSSGIGKKIIITEDTIASFRKSSKGEPGNNKETADALKQQREKELKLYADEKLAAINRTGIINNKKMFDNISIIFN